jgi:hypothetical protein
MKTENIERRKKVITEVINLSQVFYKNDKQMLSAIVDLTVHLEVADYDEVSIDFVNGMYGFMLFANGRTDVNSRSAFTTLIHDLGEFSRNRNENWFCPRTAGYTKYLSGASGVEI